ncbi:MAG: hypothetical protein ACN6OM_07630 [Alcaligenes nematophilus]|uniref:hypothetical protein n=1 Tax=Alcaligenes nematophilus TaxID=2994643 RepID=UPI003D022DF9
MRLPIKPAVLLLILFCTPVVAAITEDNTQIATRLYQLDMFSLISFGLAITALLLAFFMAWLSWEFYKRSKESSDKTNETVTRVETLIAGVQASISEIVNRAVNHWIATGGGDGQINQSKQEIYDKLGELEQAIQSGGNANSEGLLKEVATLKSQFDELGRGIRESQIKALFPSAVDEIPALRYEQEITRADNKEQSGFLRIFVLRPTRIATATVRFDPIFSSAPELNANLISSPYENTSEISAKPGTPSERAGNIHLNSTTTLKSGTYIFEYVARER